MGVVSDYFVVFESCFVTLMVLLVFISGNEMVSRFVLMFIVYQVLLYVIYFVSMGVCLCIVSLCSGCDGWCAFCLI